MSIAIFVIVLLVLVLVHEAGHFFTAKGFGIRVDEFGFGFPPKLFGKKFGETEYTINLLPLGGFVKIFGEDVDEADFVEVGFLDKDVAPERIELAKRSLISKPKWQQALVLFAGISANFLLAWLLFSICFMSGLPTSADSEIAGQKLTNINLVITSVLPSSPAESTGLQIGDKIISIKNGDKYSAEVNPDTVVSYVVDSEGKNIEIGYLRGQNENINYATISPIQNTETGKYQIGISMDMVGIAKLPFFSAFWQGLQLTWSMLKSTVLGLYTLISQGLQGRGTLEAVTGPIGMVGIVGDAYKFGFIYLLSFTALISINLTVINLLPVPALDGGRLLFLLIEKIKGSRINPKLASTVNMIGFYALILLMLIITYHDVVKLF